MAEEATTVAALTPDPRNRRRHPARNVDMIAASLRAVGAARSIVIDETNEVLAGNGVLEGAAAAGLSRVQIVDADGETIVAVRRTGLTADQKRDLALYDNRTAELAEWNLDQLAIDAADGVLQPFFFDDELAVLFGTDGKPITPAAGLADRFGVPPFSVLDARQGYWQARKAAWLALGIESEIGRGAGDATPPHPPTVTQNPDGTLNYGGTKGTAKRFDAQRQASPGGSPRPAMRQPKDGRGTVRGDGRGRPLSDPPVGESGG